MPPKLALQPQALQVPRRRPAPIFFCPSCSTWRLSQRAMRPRASPLPSLNRRANHRYASTISPATQINAPVEVIPEHQELYEALDEVKNVAGGYVNLSRLQLALRGLQMKEPVVRVAVLGLGEQRIARRLVRALLADPLGEEELWERELEGEGDGRGLLLRFGHENDTSSIPTNPLLKTIPIPSRTLQENNLEILISSINVNLGEANAYAATDSPTDAILVPTLQIPTSFSGRHTLVTYPVHKTIVAGQGIENALAFGQFTRGQISQVEKVNMIKVAIGLPAPENELSPRVSDGSFAVDIDLANSAISKFRESVANSRIYERGWFRSGVAPLQTFLGQGSQSPKLAVRNMIKSILNDSVRNIQTEETQTRRQSALSSPSIPSATKSSILSAITTWAEHSHRELRDQLDAAFAGRHWRKITWWKLFWRVDDVTMIASEVLERRWLHDAEKGIIFVAGRIREAGFSSAAVELGPITSSALPEVVEERQGGFAEPPPPTLKGLMEEDMMHADEGLTFEPKSTVWPPQIHMMRARLLADTVPPLQALAQTLVLQTYSTTGLMSALAALTYVASPAWALEAGAIAALGVVYSLRRLQRKWEGAREFWEGEVREEARKALKVTEEGVRMSIVDFGGKVEEVDGAKERQAAKAVVKKANEVLKKTFGEDMERSK